MSRELEGKVAVVTGGGIRSGTGRDSRHAGSRRPARGLPLVVVTDSDLGDEVERAVLEGKAELRTAGAHEPAEVIAAAEGASALLVQWARISADVFDALPTLRAVVRYGIGLDNIDLDAAAEHGVTVRNVDDYCLDEVADHAAAAVTAAARRLVAFDRRVKAGEWGPHTAQAPVPPDEDPVGIVGFGRIGSAVASRVEAAGHPVFAWDPVAASSGVRGVEFVDSLEQLAERVNHLCLHVPATPRTAGLIEAAVLERLGPDGHLVNTARGQLVNETALLAWLDANSRASASLDVFAAEPPTGVSRELAVHPRVLATPHVAYLSTASLPRLRRAAAMHVLEALGAEPSRVRD